jgi:cystatin-A/B
MKTGAFGGATSHIGDEEKELLNSVKPAIVQHLNKDLSKFEVVSCARQVVAGMNYLFKVAVDGDEVIHVKVHQPLPHTGHPPHLMSLQTGQTLDSPLTP